MFYQVYVNNKAAGSPVDYMDANQAYYLSTPIEGNDIKVVGDNGSYMLTNGQQVIYNPLINAKIENNNNIKLYKITNLIENKVVSKIQVEFSENNKNVLSNHAIFINTDMIQGYRQTNNEDINTYTFETIDDVTTKIRYLGVIPTEISKEEFIILNYYTTE